MSLSFSWRNKKTEAQIESQWQREKKQHHMFNTNNFLKSLPFVFIVAFVSSHYYCYLLLLLVLLVLATAAGVVAKVVVVIVGIEVFHLYLLDHSPPPAIISLLTFFLFQFSFAVSQ